ncbi:LD-carboxypeptidase [Actinomadura viridis]|uniref:Muramoyltetrapeptide carboxypeptidase n=1 Tax=Actinomadura viridis TaxID=58110 RepID=A0A931DFC1_9ACTN|nr:LD-carboxypeptidase [Actinomadura viridis]MBG6090089.1 muramoyltetrapeptide carboxypeptidase [Actinomadura viridis]
MSGVARTEAEDDHRFASDRSLDRTPVRRSETALLSGPHAGRSAPGDSGGDSGAPGAEHAPRVRPRRFAPLRPGDRVAVIAPSGPVVPARLEAGCDLLRELGLKVSVGGHALDRTGLGGHAHGGHAHDGSGAAGPEDVPDGWHRLAGGDAARAADLAAAWCDPEVRAVLCARGGYGATRLLGRLDWDALAAATRGTAPKILHGSSDVTALHVAFGARLGITTSFGPMIAGELLAEGTGDRARSLAHLRAALFGNGGDGDGGDTAGATGPVEGTHALRPGRCEGLLTGGTLSLLAALLGTPDAPPPAAGRIVFLEDVSEAPYRIDRMLTQLLQAGWFDGAAGVVLGSWTGCGDPAELDAVLAGRLGPLGVPVLAGVPVGHGPCQLTLELGAPYRLDTDVLTLDALPGGVR